MNSRLIAKFVTMEADIKKRVLIALFQSLARSEQHLMDAFQESEKKAILHQIFNSAKRDVENLFRKDILEEFYEKLSPAQLAICELIAAGKQTKEVADELGISVRTVENHRNAIRKAVGLHGKKQNLAMFLKKAGFGILSA